MPFAFERSILTRNIMPFFTMSGSLGTILDGNRNTANNIITNPIATSQAGLPSHSIVAGNLPDGLTLNSNGTITGTADSVTSNTTSTFTVRATIEGLSTDREFTITVNRFEISGGINFNPVSTAQPGYGFPDPIYLTDMSYVMSTDSMLPTTGTQNEVTFSVWLKPQSISSVAHFIFKITEAANTDYAYMSVAESGVIAFKFGTIDLANFSRSTLNYDAWNHILISIQRDHTASLTFGTAGGSTFDYGGTYRSYNGPSTGQRFTVHLVINGTAYHRYIDPNGAFFQNDFASGSSGASATFGYVSYNSTSSDLFTMSSTDNTILGGHYGTATSPQTGVGYYKGDMAELWMKNSYYDLTDINNIRLFRNASGRPVDPPAAPTTYFKGYASAWTNAGSLNVGTVTKNLITDASTLP